MFFLTRSLVLLCLVAAEARAMLPAICGPELDKPSATQRLQMLVPAGVRRTARHLIPALQKPQLDALHARLAEILPADFAERILERPWRVHLEDFFPDRSGKSLKSWLTRVNEAIAILAEIQDVTDRLHGAESEESGLVHLSRALIYNFATDKQAAVEHRNPAYTYGVMTAHNEFDRAATTHGREAVRLLARHENPYETVARLQHLKQLVQSARVTSNRNAFHLSTGAQVAPDAEMEPLLTEAKAELERLLATYMQRTTREDLRGWIYAGAMVQKMEIEHLDYELEYGFDGRYAKAHQRENHAEERATRGEDLLAVLVANRAGLPRLLGEGRHGALERVIANIVRAYDYISLCRMNRALDDRREAYRALWRKLMDEKVSVDEFLAALRALGFEINESTARLN